MAANFIGITVRVSLSDPPGEQVRGAVKDVGAGQQLTLAEGMTRTRQFSIRLPHADRLLACSITTGEYHHVLVIPAKNVVELDIEPDDLPQPAVNETIDDPAIVSFERKRVQVGELHGPSSQRAPSNSVSNHLYPLPQQHIANGIVNTRAHGAVAKSAQQFKTGVPSQIPTRSGPDVEPSATLKGPFTELSLNVPINGSKKGLTSPVSQPNRNAVTKTTQPESARTSFLEPKKPNKRGKRAGRPRPDPANVSNAGGLNPTAPSKDFPTWKAGIPHDKPASRRGNRRKGPYNISDYEDRNGWATGEVTDIQDMGDFDFEESLSKFDKRKVFDQIRQEDTTADEERLYSFNRQPRPGTAGGKNLHCTENVLDSPRQKAAEHSSQDENIGVGDTRRGSDRGGRRFLAKKSPSRQGSGMTSTDPQMTASGSLPDIMERRPLSGLSNSVKAPVAMTKSFSCSGRSSSQLRKSCFHLIRSYRPCPCVSPLQMLELEQLAISEFGLTEDMMTENAARCIAETALDITQAANETSNAESRHLSPLTVVLCGNTKTGSRAVAAARHLRNHGARLIVCMLGLEREDELLENVRRQLQIYRSCSGRVIRQDQLMRTLNQLQSPTDLIIDALLGMHLSFDDLRTDHQAAVYELVCWANGAGADILSIDIPSGIDASTGNSPDPPPFISENLINPLTGKATQHEETEIGIQADHILSLGAPKNGLLSYQVETRCNNNHNNTNDHPLASRDFRVADIGIPNAAWKRFGKKGRRGIDFGGDWVAHLDYSHDGLR